jgi:hypothetical protein
MESPQLRVPSPRSNGATWSSSVRVSSPGRWGAQPGTRPGTGGLASSESTRRAQRSLSDPDHPDVPSEPEADPPFSRWSSRVVASWCGSNV